MAAVVAAATKGVVVARDVCLSLDPSSFFAELVLVFVALVVAITSPAVEMLLVWDVLGRGRDDDRAADREDRDCDVRGRLFRCGTGISSLCVCHSLTQSPLCGLFPLSVVRPAWGIAVVGWLGFAMITGASHTN